VGPLLGPFPLVFKAPEFLLILLSYDLSKEALLVFYLFLDQFVAVLSGEMLKGNCFPGELVAGLDNSPLSWQSEEL